MVEIEKNPYGFAGGKIISEGIRSGKVVAISDFMTYYGMNTYAFDKSLMDEDLLRQVHDKYKSLVGERVYWPERSESGTDIEYDGKQYVFVKLSSIMGVEA